MRVTFVSHSSGMAGAERSLLGLVEYGVQRGDDVSVIVPGAGPIVAALEQAGASPVVRRPNHWWMSRRGGGVIGVARTLLSILDVAGVTTALLRTRPDVVVVNSSVAPAGMIAARSLRIPLVVVVRESLSTNPTLRSVVPKILITAMIARLASSVVAISKYVADQYGRPCEVIRPHVTPIQALRDAHRGDGRDGEIRLLMLGSLGGEKGQEDALRALSLVNAVGGRFHLEVRGPGGPSAEKELRALASELGVSHTVTIGGAVSSVSSAFGRADASLVLSRNEGYGRVTVESLMCGVPVIGYAQGGTEEILLGGGGILVEPDVDALASALVSLNREPDLLRSLTTEARSVGDTFVESDSRRDFYAVIAAASRAVNGPSGPRGMTSDALS